jgi:hypothetical protein
MAEYQAANQPDRQPDLVSPCKLHKVNAAARPLNLRCARHLLEIEGLFVLIRRHGVSQVERYVPEFAIRRRIAFKNGLIVLEARIATLPAT